MYRAQSHCIAGASVWISVGHNKIYENVDFIGCENVARAIAESSQGLIAKMSYMPIGVNDEALEASWMSNTTDAD